MVAVLNGSQQAPPGERDRERAAAEVAPEPGDEDGEDEGNTYADWNVPSWQELIASLYRPDH
jgi:hypothetical protein